MQIVPVLATALGMWHGGPLPDLPEVSEAAEARKFSTRTLASLNRFLWRRAARRRTTGRLDDLLGIEEASASRVRKAAQ
jgi:hypothetical protein